ncbi:MAG: hypothetical protein KAY32_17835 [Candidatus Eisenbacteria sp.]|nr:hypothetical protein [Candidatus Eisenbacteria bacterium]
MDNDEAARSTLFPDLPQFTEQDWQKCEGWGSYVPMLFDWYRHTGQVCATVAGLSQTSPVFMSILAVHYAILVGMLVRCSRLMLSVVALSSRDEFAETTRLIDRCIAETAITIHWLCASRDPDRFSLYLEDSVRSEAKLKNLILGRIWSREGIRFPIEERLLRQIDEVAESTQLSGNALANPRRLPSFAQRCRDLRLPEEVYCVGYRLGSAAVHGSWVDLLEHYLVREESGDSSVKGTKNRPDETQFVATTKLVLGALAAFIQYMTDDKAAMGIVLRRLRLILDAVNEIMKRSWGGDFLQPEDAEES